ncbi:MAG: HU family DNA-binding protein [Planctomycetota bacterium]|nr:MAG: HU family DNA-binding protein [Planctomycetota bacterium]
MARPDVRTITKKELVDQIAERNGLSRTKAQVIVQDVLDTVIAVLSDGHRLELRDFGVFEVKTLAPRTGAEPPHARARPCA